MSRISHFGCATLFALFVARPVVAEAQASLAGAWQYCEPNKGCSKFAFRPNGDVIEQFPLSGKLVTAFGRYDIQGTVLKIGWTRFSPTEVCVESWDANGEARKQCMPTVQPDIEASFRFDGLNSLIWTEPHSPLPRLVRIKL